LPAAGEKSERERKWHESDDMTGTGKLNYFLNLEAIEWQNGQASFYGDEELILLQ
jgi:hypothetical protein